MENHYQIYQEPNRDWRWRAIASNGKKLADSGEGYRNKQDCLDGIRMVSTSGTWKVYPVNR